MLPATVPTSARHCVVQHFAGSRPKEEPPPKGTYRLTFAVRVRCGILQIFKRNYGYVDVSRTRRKAHNHANAQMAHRKVECI